jgi:hypothetical protein
VSINIDKYLLGAVMLRITGRQGMSVGRPSPTNANKLSKLSLGMVAIYQHSIVACLG